jgi:hypothetical protein
VSYPLRRALIVGTALTLAALGVMFASSGIRARVLDAYLVSICGVAVLMLIRTARALLPERRSSAFAAALAELRREPPPAGELGIERDVELSRLSEFHFHMRLRPVLREIAALRLRRRYGLELDREPLRARELVPSATWEVIRPDRPPPADRLSRGPSPASLRTVVSELERL